MANVIKLKRGSGSDPQASDLEVGELAIRTDQGKIFTKKDNGNVAEISGGGGVSDGDKGDITVSNSGDTFTIDSGVVNNTKVASNAAIAGTKISPDFGSQDIKTSASLQVGNVSGDNYSELLTVIGSSNGTSARGFTCQHSSLTVLENLQGTTNQHLVLGDVNTDNGSTLFGISLTQGGSTVTRLNLTGSGNLNVHNNITLGGTVDGRNVANDGTKLDGIESGATADQTASEILSLLSDQNIDTTGYIQIGGATPSLYLTDSNNNPDYIVRNNNGTFVIRDGTNGADRLQISSVGSSILGRLTTSGDYNYLQSSSTSTSTLTLKKSASGADSIDYIQARDSSNALKFKIGGAGNAEFAANVDFGAGIDVTGDIISTAHITGVSDSTEASFIAKGDGSSQDGYIQLNCSQNSHGIKLKSPAHSAGQSYTLTFPSSIVNNGALLTDTNGNLSTSLIGTSNISDNAVTMAKLQDLDQNRIFGRVASGVGNPTALTATQVRTLINVENGATADQTASEIRTLVESASDSNVFTDADHTKLNGIESNATADQTASEILTLIKTVDGAGSGLDADFFDGLGSGSFLRSDAGDEATGDITFSGGAGAIRIAANSDIRLANGDWTGNTSAAKIQLHNNYLYIAGGSNGIIFREDSTNRWQIDGSGHFDPASDSTYDIGQSDRRVRNGYFDTLYGSGANLTNLPSQTDQNFTTALKNKLDGIAAGATNVTNNNQISNGAGYITSAALSGVSDGGNAASLDGIDSSQFLRSDQADTMTGDLTIDNNAFLRIGDGSGTERILIKKVDNNVSDHIIFYNGTTRVGEIGVEDTSWLRLNQETATNIYTPRYIRADGGFFVDGTSKGINGSGNFIGGTIAGASDVSVNAGNNTIVRRHSSGYIFSNFINTTDNSVSSGVTAVMVKTGSDYHRSGTAAAVRAFLNVEDGATAGGFPSGTRMIFQQTSAPTGWTKDTSDTNQRALRVVSGSASSGGSVDFTTAFASKSVSGSVANTTQGGSIANGGNNTNNANSSGNVNNHTLSTSRMPSHKHIGGDRNIHDMANGWYGMAGNNQGGVNYPGARYDPGNPYAQTDKSWTSNAGSTQAHSHSFTGTAHSHSINAHSHSFSGSAHNHSFSGTAINLAVRYLDVIIAQKD